MIRLPADSPERIIKQMSTYNKSQTTRTLEIFHKCLCVSEEKPNKHVRTLNCKQQLSICHLKICLPGLNFTVSGEFPINQSESNKKCSELSEFHNQVTGLASQLGAHTIKFYQWFKPHLLLWLYVLINLKLQQSPFPSDNQHAFDHHLYPAGGEFEPCLVWVENLKWKCDVFPAELMHCICFKVNTCSSLLQANGSEEKVYKVHKV